MSKEACEDVLQTISLHRTKNFPGWGHPGTADSVLCILGGLKLPVLLVHQKGEAAESEAHFSLSTRNWT